MNVFSHREILADIDALRKRVAKLERKVMRNQRNKGQTPRKRDKR
jgi:hypothetical protein